MNGSLLLRGMHGSTRALSALSPRALAPLLAAFLSSLALTGSVARAQGTRTTVTNWNSWYVFSSDNAISEHWSLVTDVLLRREHGGDSPQQTMVRPGILYQVAPGVRIGGGYGYVVTYPYGGDPIAAPLPEHRLWEQVSLSQQVGNFALTHRYRLEQRWIGVGDPVTPSRVASYREESRFRYFFRAIHNLGRPTGVFLQVYDEVFVTAGASARNNLLDQNRFFVGGGWRFTPMWRLEVGYMEQRIWKSSGLSAERNHTLSVTLHSTGPLR